MSEFEPRCRLELPSDLVFPALLEGEYLHSYPFWRHREQMGFPFEHLTFARKHPSHDWRSFGWRGFPLEDMLREELGEQVVGKCRDGSPAATQS